MAKTGRPKIEIDWEQFDKLCMIQCTLIEIASWFDCTSDTIERAVLREKKISFADYFTIKRGKGKIALRRKQYEVALSGNTYMLCWLGKQYLEQADKQDMNLNNNLKINNFTDLVKQVNGAAKNVRNTDDNK